MVWFSSGKISRIVLNIRGDSKLGELPALLGKVYGTPGETAGIVTTWSKHQGAKIQLNIDAAAQLRIE